MVRDNFISIAVKQTTDRLNEFAIIFSKQFVTWLPLASMRPT